MTYLQAYKMHAQWEVMALHIVAVKIVNLVPFFNENGWISAVQDAQD